MIRSIIQIINYSILKLTLQSTLGDHFLINIYNILSSYKEV